jgi:hypothetical protein
MTTVYGRQSPVFSGIVPDRIDVNLTRSVDRRRQTED